MKYQLSLPQTSTGGEHRDHKDEQFLYNKTISLIFFLEVLDTQVCIDILPFNFFWML